MDDINQARTDATLEIGNRIIDVVTDSLRRHGHDPYNISIVAAAFAYSIDFINAINPEFRPLLQNTINNAKLNEQADNALKTHIEKHMPKKDNH